MSLRDMFGKCKYAKGYGKLLLLQEIRFIDTGMVLALFTQANKRTSLKFEI